MVKWSDAGDLTDWTPKEGEGFVRLSTRSAADIIEETLARENGDPVDRAAQDSVERPFFPREHHGRLLE